MPVDTAEPLPQAEPEALITPELVSWFNARWQHNAGAVDGHDLRFLAELIRQHRPQRFLEIGCATGLSTAATAPLMNRALPEGASALLSSIDLATRFYNDKTKPVGYRIPEALPHPRVTIELHTGCTALDTGRIAAARPYDMCLIDATHQHPWPLLDTLAVLPWLREGAIMVHHDLKMAAEGVYGPKMVHDHVPRDLLILPGETPGYLAADGLVTRHISDNIFAIRVPGPKGGREALLAGLLAAMSEPWHAPPRAELQADFAIRFDALLRAHYPAPFSLAFRAALGRFGGPGVAESVAIATASPPVFQRARRVLRRLFTRSAN